MRDSSATVADAAETGITTGRLITESTHQDRYALRCGLPVLQIFRPVEIPQVERSRSSASTNRAVLARSVFFLTVDVVSDTTVSSSAALAHSRRGIVAIAVNRPVAACPRARSRG